MIYKFNNLSSLPNCTHGITKKTPSKPQKFSLAMHTGEDIGVSFSNRLEVMSLLGVANETKIVLASQTHSDNIIIVDNLSTCGWESMDDAIADCDALISSRVGVMIGVMTADCVPILLFDTQKNIVAAVHAGWRGTQSNIVGKTVHIMQKEFGCKDIIAGVGPSIGACCYEVDKNLADKFSVLYGDGVSFVSGKYMLDLPLINKLQLIKSGVADGDIESSNVCTACENDSYFSYRKESGCSGRFGSFIGVV